MLQELPHLRYDLKSLWGASDQRVWSPKRSLSYLQRRWRSQSNLPGSVGQGVRVEGVLSSVGDCWKGLRIRSTLECLWNSEVVRVQRMPKVSEVRVGKTPRCFRSRKQVIPWHLLNLTERSYKIEGSRLSAGATHKLKPSPSIQPESWNICIPLGSTSYIPVPYQISMWISS